MDSLFAQQRIRFLTANDFELTSGTALSLKDKSCFLVLFHNNNEKSHRLASIWTDLATKVVGPIFASCDVMNEPQVVQAFNRVALNRDNPLSWLNLKRVPLIVTYRDGFPIGAYNSVISESKIMSYASKLVCSADYHETTIVTDIPDELPETEQDHPVYRA